FMHCFSSVFVHHSTPSIPYAIPPTTPSIIRSSVPLSVLPIICIERSKQGVTFNKELFALIGGICILFICTRKSLKEVNEVNEAIEVVNEINE
ncbi:18230_t:CDS:2, partial [Rhizophagus irregularis]